MITVRGDLTMRRSIWNSLLSLEYTVCSCWARYQEPFLTSITAKITMLGTRIFKRMKQMQPLQREPLRSSL